MAWNRSSGAPKVAPKKSPSAMHGIVAGAAVIVVLGTLCLWMFSSGGDAPKDGSDKERGRIKSVKPVASGNVSNEKDDRVRRLKSEFNERVKEYVKAPLTNKADWVKSPYDPKDPDNALRTRLAQDIALLIAIVPGEPMPPLPFAFMAEDQRIEAASARGEKVITINNGNKQFLEDLKKWRVTIKDTDKDSTVEYKAKFVDAQMELLKGIDEGVSVNDSIRAAYEFRKQAYELRQETIKTLRELHNEDSDVNATRKLIEEANKKLSAEGIRNVFPREIIPDYDYIEAKERGVLPPDL